MSSPLLPNDNPTPGQQRAFARQLQKLANTGRSGARSQAPRARQRLVGAGSKAAAAATPAGNQAPPPAAPKRAATVVSRAKATKLAGKHAQALNIIGKQRAIIQAQRNAPQAPQAPQVLQLSPQAVRALKQTPAPPMPPARGLGPGGTQGVNRTVIVGVAGVFIVGTTRALLTRGSSPDAPLALTPIAVGALGVLVVLSLLDLVPGAQKLAGALAMLAFVVVAIADAPDILTALQKQTSSPVATVGKNLPIT